MGIKIHTFRLPTHLFRRCRTNIWSSFWKLFIKSTSRDLKVIGLLMSMQVGFTEYCCFLYLWDNRTVSKNYRQDLESMSTFLYTEQCPRNCTRCFSPQSLYQAWSKEKFHDCLGQKWCGLSTHMHSNCYLFFDITNLLNLKSCFSSLI